MNNKKSLKILLFVFLICFSLLTLSACEMEEDAPLYGYFTHSFSKWETVQEATCVTQGIKKRTCVLCGKEQIKYIEAGDNHTDGGWRIILQPTCTEPGKKGHYCPICGQDWEFDIIPVLGHSFGAWTITKNATCTENGLRKRVCSGCGKEETEIIVASHDWNSYYTTDREATCTVDGEKSIHCKKCDARKDIRSIPAGHDYGPWTNKEEASCTEDGLKEQVCRRCGDKRTAPIPAPGHKDVDDDGYCDNCHEWLATDPVDVSIIIDDKISEYGASLKTLTYHKANKSDPTPRGISLTKAAGNSVGSYAITGECSSPYFNVTFTNGTYYIITAGLKFKYTDNAYSVTGYTGTATDVIIPDVYSDDSHGFKNVTAIEEDAFKRCTDVHTITLGQNIKAIGSCAFFGCRNLTSVTVPASVERIGNCSFSGCQSLTSINFAAASGWKRIAASSTNAFANWTVKSGGDSIDLSSASDAANKLSKSDQYVDYYLYR